MAILKDLIVNGPSRFIGDFTADAIKAEEGYFTKLIAKDLTAQNATVLGLLDVKGELHTKSWTAENIASIGGSFYITPTLIAESSASGKGFTKTNNTTATITGSFSTGNLLGGSETTSSWSTGALVLVTGEVLYNNEYIPLGTLKGSITAITGGTAATSITVGSITDNKNNTSSVMESLSTSLLPYRNLRISIYQLSGGLPIGIFMSATGSNGTTFIDIYNGALATSTSPSGSGALARPVLRIGNLKGLTYTTATGDTVTASGWGIFTSNGFFEGTLYSKVGRIGGWVIDSNNLYTGTWGSASSAMLCTGTSTAKSIGGSSSISGWVFTAGANFGVTNAGALYCNSANITGAVNASSGYIGSSATNKITISSNATNAAIYTASHTSLDATGNGFYLGVDGLSIGSAFKVTSAGALTASSATITGEIKATKGTIGNSATNKITISDNATNAAIYSGSHSSLTSTAATGFYLGTDGLSFANQVFKVTSAGALTATSATITGTINASSGYIGNGATNKITISANTTNAALYTASHTSLSATGNGFYLGVDGLSIGASFKVTNTGVLTASSVDLTGAIKASSGYIGNNATNKITIGTNTTNAALYSGSHSTLASTVDGFYLGADGLSIGSRFNATKEGIVTIGADGTTLELRDSALIMTNNNSDGEQKQYFVAKDIRSELGSGTITDTFTGDGSRKSFTLRTQPNGIDSSNMTVTINGSAYSNSNISQPNVNGTSVITLASAPASGAAIKVVYKPSEHSGGNAAAQRVDNAIDIAKIFTLGSRYSSDTDSGMGLQSTVIGHQLQAKYDYQLVIGRYNNNKMYNPGGNNYYYNAFEIGWGSSNSDRKNIFAVDVLGNVYTKNATQPIGHRATTTISQQTMYGHWWTSPSSPGGLTIGNITLSKGAWIIICHIEFLRATNQTSFPNLMKGARLDTSSTLPSSNPIYDANTFGNKQGQSGANFDVNPVLTFTKTVVLTESTTFYLHCWAEQYLNANTNYHIQGWNSTNQSGTYIEAMKID